MPIDTQLATKQWTRFCWCRDNGHAQFVQKAEKCDAFFRGDQWDRADKARLEAVRRPALTINKILSTISNVLGEQIFNRAETSFRPRSGAPSEVADILTKVFKQISDNNQLDWKRSDMFADGAITSRGFLDVRIGYGDSMQGEVVVDNLNPKNVIIDPDGEEYDPDSWSEVFTTKWVTADDIAVLYNKDDAEYLRNREQSFFPYGYDSIQAFRDRFGDRFNPMYTGDYDNSSVMRNIRLIERQYRLLDRQKHFVDPATGDMRPIPDDFDRNKIALMTSQYGLQVTTKLVRRIRWTVIADNVRLHDDWSPYKHFTVVPFFPYFRRGTTIGLVENLLGPQELLNKVSSQELHVINTTANSGWKVKTGSLTNMTVEELEEKGAQTGLVVEVNDVNDIEKIQPNQVPTGLDRITYKAEEHIKTISGVSDSAQGFDREDVAAKAIQAKRQAGATNLAKPMDSLSRTDHILARNILDLVQQFYTEERIMTITHDEATGETETFAVNEVSPEGQIVNDLTLGEYDVVVSSVPRRETLEDSQFEQAMALREMGVMIPDSVLIDSSRLMNKKDIIKQMQGDQESPEAQAAAELQRRAQEAEVGKAEGEAAQKHADAQLKGAKTQETIVKAQVLANTPPDAPDAGNPELEAAKAQHEADLAEREFEHRRVLDYQKLGLQRQQHNDKLSLQAQQQAQERLDKRAEASREAAMAAQKPQTTQPTKGLR
ncbi:MULTISPECIES: portal protein [unclassified Acidovorax]|uniref:portal protein n=1 Tax=unclassified Acidovorax TaxID=2684926 RepID=UPI000B4069D1|nr:MULTISPECIES: genomic island protein [unclassified Acidovorax]